MSIIKSNRISSILFKSIFKNDINRSLYFKSSFQTLAKKIKIYSTLTLPNESLQLFDNLKNRFDIQMNQNIICERSKFLKSVKDCDSIIVSPYDRIDKEVLDCAGNNLKFISAFSIGYEHINLDECFSRNIRITTCPYLDSGAMAEFTIGFMLNISRNITSAINIIKGADWIPLRKDLYWLSGVSLKDSVVGIFGMGSIGMSVSERLASFKVKKIIYNNRRPNLEADKLGYEYVSFDELLKQSDFLICSSSLNKQSEKIFNRNAFNKMKKSSIFINVARGLCVDQDDLFDALSNNIIRAAGLDVTTPQPLPANHKLYSLSNCFITPHLAWSETKTTNDRISLAVQNIANFFEGKNLINELKI